MEIDYILESILIDYELIIDSFDAYMIHIKIQSFDYA